MCYLLEVFVDNFIAIAIPRSKNNLHHVANAVMHGIHNFFPKTEDNTKDPISLKKHKKKVGAWALNKEIL